MEKLCLFCKKFVWDAIGTGPDYSEYTGGDNFGGATCKAGHFNEERPYDVEDFRAVILRAESCKDYVPDTGTDSTTT